MLPGVNFKLRVPAYLLLIFLVYFISYFSYTYFNVFFQQPYIWVRNVLLTSAYIIPPVCATIILRKWSFRKRTFYVIVAISLAVLFKEIYWIVKLNIVLDSKFLNKTIGTYFKLIFISMCFYFFVQLLAFLINSIIKYYRKKNVSDSEQIDVI